MPDGEEGGTDEARRVPNRMPDPVGEVVSARDGLDAHQRQVGTDSTPFGILSPGLGSETFETRSQPALDAVLQTQPETLTPPLPASRLAPHVETHEVAGDDHLTVVGEVFFINEIIKPFEGDAFDATLPVDTDGDALQYVIAAASFDPPSTPVELQFGVSKANRAITKEYVFEPDAAVWDSRLISIAYIRSDLVEPSMDLIFINNMNMHRHDIRAIRKLWFRDTDSPLGTTTGIQSRGDAAGAILEVVQVSAANSRSSPVYRRLRLADPVGDDDATTKRYVDGLAVPVVAEGDIIIANATPAWIALSRGTARQLLQMNSGALRPEWASNIDIPGTLDVTGAAVFDGTLSINDANFALAIVGADPRNTFDSTDYMEYVRASNRWFWVVGGAEQARLGTSSFDMTNSGDFDIYASFADIQPRARFSANSIRWGPGGSSTQDVVLSRSVANRLDLSAGDDFRLVSGDAEFVTGKASKVFTTLGDANPLASYGATLEFGVGAASALDVALFRGAANRLDLASGDSLEIVLGNINIGGDLTLTGTVDGVDIAAHPGLPNVHHAQAHAAAQHNAAALPGGANENLSAFYLDIDDIAVPANPGVGIRRLFVDTATAALSVRTSAGTTINLEAGGGYTDAQAIAAVEGEATLALSGAVDITGILTVDTINEKTGAVGVDIEAVRMLDGFVELTEIADPGAGSANDLRLYAIDVGGTTGLQITDSAGVDTTIVARTRYLWLHPNDFVSLLGAPTLMIAGGWAVGGRVWSMPGSGTTGVSTKIALPSDWVSGTVKFTSYYQGSGGNGNNRRFSISMTAITPGTDSEIVAVGTTEDTTVAHGNGIVTSFTTPTGLTVAAGDIIRVSFARAADHADDTNVDAAHFIGMRMEYTSFF